MALGVGGAFVALSWLIWLVGGLLELARTGTWREVPVASAPLLLARLLAHPMAPARAWPPLIRRSLPSSGVTDACLASVVVAVILGLAAGWLLWNRSGARRSESALCPERPRAVPRRHRALATAGPLRPGRAPFAHKTSRPSRERGAGPNRVTCARCSSQKQLATASSLGPTAGVSWQLNRGIR